jgi:hypothetical protein
MGKRLWRAVALGVILLCPGTGCRSLCDWCCGYDNPPRIAADPCYDPCAPTGPPPIVRYGSDCP